MSRIISLMAILLLLCSPTVVMAQSGDDPILSILNKYEKEEGIESITISPSLLALMQKSKNNDQKTQELVAKITGLRILTVTDKPGQSRKPLSEQFFSDLQSIGKTGFEQIMKVKSDKDNVELYVSKGDKKAVLLFISSEKNSATAIYLSGLIDKALIDAVMNGEIGVM